MNLKKVFSNEIVRQTLNNIPDGLLVADHSARVIWANDAVLTRSNLTNDELINYSLIDLEKRGVFSPSVSRLVLEQRKVVKSVQLTNTNTNRNNPFVTTGYPIVHNEKIIGVITHSRYLPDIIQSTKRLDESEALLKRYTIEVRKALLESIDRTSPSLIGRSSTFRHVLNQVEIVAPTTSTVLLTGETGVGKTAVARRIHEYSTRYDGPFIEVNCGAIPESLMESELFGYEKASFTGANESGKAGLVEIADGGTLLLDEIGELPLAMQVKLLHFLQDQTFLPIGAVKSKKVNVRIIAATNKKLEEEVKEGNFRADLFYRLHVFPIEIPPLRERKDDIIPLLQEAFQRFNKKYGHTTSLQPEVTNLLLDYSWPGNIRELENFAERSILTYPHHEITIDDLPNNIKKAAKLPSFLNLKNDGSLTAYLDSIEKTLIANALQQYGTTRKAAKHLGITQSLLMRRIKKYGIVLQ